MPISDFKSLTSI